MKKIAISQSNYIPWKGYFDNIAAVDTFVLYDDVQYTRRDWRNRNKIKTSAGEKWLSIPVEVKGKYFQKIEDTKINDSEWGKKHLNIILENYRKAPAFKEVKDWVSNLYKENDSVYLSEVNYHFIKNICLFLGIDTELRWSKEFPVIEGRNERLIAICNELNADTYYSGPAAKFYIEEPLFQKEGIEVKWFEKENYKEYSQINGEFNHYVSIFDLIFHEGENAKNFLNLIK